jgi:hypothetical protein
MPTYVDPQACDACAGYGSGAAVRVHLPQRPDGAAPGYWQGFQSEPEMCSECYARSSSAPGCDPRGYADFVPLGAMVQPKRVEQGLRWTADFGTDELHFTYPSRSTPVDRASRTGGLLKIRSVICRARHWRGVGVVGC